MFSYSIFGNQPAELTRFDHSEELKPIAVILASLRKKEVELKRAKAYRGAESVDFEKHTVVAKLLEEMDEVIDAFNERPAQAEYQNEIRDMMNLVESLENLVKSTLLRHTDTLRKFRDAQREMVAKTVDWGLFLGSLGALYTMPFSLLTKFGIYVFGMKSAKEAIMDYTGLTEDETRSMIILKGLRSSLHKSYVNLRRTMHPEFVDEEARRLAGQRAAQRNGGHDAEAEESGLLFLLAPGTQQYVDSLSGRPQLSNIVDELELTSEEDDRFKEFQCPISLMVMDVPVRLEEDHYDLECLLALPINADGQRTNPLNRNLFYPRDIQPARAVYNTIQERIEEVKKARDVPEHQSPRP